MRRRASTFDELTTKMRQFSTDAGRAAGLAFTPRASDVIIAPYSKCGTTWMQTIVHSLRSGGDLGYDDICRVIPYIEVAHDLELDLDAEQRWTPRAFKSHLPWTEIPKGARYIVVTRDPRDALVSSYRFVEDWFFDPGVISLEEFGRHQYATGGGYYRHLTSWWPRRHDSTVLMLAYEHMRANLVAAVRRVAEFIGVTDESRIAIAHEQSTLAAMMAHQPRYDDVLFRQLTERRCDIPLGGDASKVRVGGSHRDELPAELLAALDATWQETVGAATGLPTYEALLAELASD